MDHFERRRLIDRFCGALPRRAHRLLIENVEKLDPLTDDQLKAALYALSKHPESLTEWRRLNRLRIRLRQYFGRYNGGKLSRARFVKQCTVQLAKCAVTHPRYKAWVGRVRKYLDGMPRYYRLDWDGLEADFPLFEPVKKRKIDLFPKVDRKFLSHLSKALK